MDSGKLYQKTAAALGASRGIYRLYVGDVELPVASRVEGLRHAIAEVESARAWLDRLCERLVNEHDDLERWASLDIGNGAPEAGSARVHPADADGLEVDSAAQSAVERSFRGMELGA